MKHGKFIDIKTMHGKMKNSHFNNHTVSNI